PRHEYTRGLLGSVLSIEAGAERLHQVPGTVPSPRDFASGDRFAPRSLDPAADPSVRPRLVDVGVAGHRVATTGSIPAPLAGDPRCPPTPPRRRRPAGPTAPAARSRRSSCATCTWSTACAAAACCDRTRSVRSTA